MGTNRSKLGEKDRIGPHMGIDLDTRHFGLWTRLFPLLPDPELLFWSANRHIKPFNIADTQHQLVVAGNAGQEKPTSAPRDGSGRTPCKAPLCPANRIDRQTERAAE